MSAPEGEPERRVFSPDFLTELFRNPLDPGYADAAARKAEGRGPSAGSAVVSRGLLAVVLVLVGIVFAVAYRKTMADAPDRVAARTALVDQIQRKRDQTEVKQATSDALRRQIGELRARELDGETAALLRNLEGETGLAPVRGDGVRVTVGDGRPFVDPNTGKHDDGRILDRELQGVVNSLWASGAEAVAINDQRLTAMSTIRAAGEAILVNDQPVANPYQIQAIGPDDMQPAFEATGIAKGMRQLATSIGVRFEVRQADAMTIAAATDPELRFAKPPVAPTPSSNSGSVVPGGPSSSPSEGGR